MIKKLLLTTVLMLSVVIAGCSSKTTTTQPDSNKPVLESTDNKDNNSSEDKDSTAENTDKKAEENIPSTENKSNKEEKSVTKATFSIYSEDPNSMEMHQSSTIEISEDLSLKDKLTTLASSLSKANFNGLPIEISSIDTIDGKKVATINLTESSVNKGVTNPSDLKSPNWRSNFQGSTGAQVTGDTLLETFLQLQYKGSWIDGVKFLYEGENIEFEHASNLSEIQYRN